MKSRIHAGQSLLLTSLSSVESILETGRVSTLMVHSWCGSACTDETGLEGKLMVWFQPYTHGNMLIIILNCALRNQKKNLFTRGRGLKKKLRYKSQKKASASKTLTLNRRIS